MSSTLTLPLQVERVRLTLTRALQEGGNQTRLTLLEKEGKNA